MSDTSGTVWRLGHRVLINVYEGDRPVCQCHNEVDATRIVAAVNDADAEAHVLVVAERQRRLDVVAELHRQIASMDRQLDAARRKIDLLSESVNILEQEALIERRRAQGPGLFTR